MFSQKDLKELIQIETSHPILSLYLNTDSTLQNQDVSRLHLKNMLKDIPANMQEDVIAVQQYIEHEYDWQSRGIALFSCADEGLLWTFNVKSPLLKDAFFIKNHAVIYPLARILDVCAGWGIIIIDKQGARLFTYNAGKLTEHEGFLGEAVRQTKGGGSGSNLHGSRGEDNGSENIKNSIHLNMKEGAAYTARVFDQRQIRRMVIGGSDENTHQFMAELPKTWQSLVAGTCALDMESDHKDILAKLLEIIQRKENETTAALVNQVITATAKGNQGALGLEAVMNEIRNGRAQIILFEEGTVLNGHQCRGCHYLTTQSLDACPFCGKTFEPLENAGEMAVHEALKNNMTVKITEGNQPLLEAGGIAAILRY